ncbi:MAG: sodium:proton antiporter, partial [Planctomycetota bacterium]|nr:sodium:proton antiporter [Planctomycetota bacterium]
MSEHHSPIPAKRSSGAVIGTIALLIVGYVVAISLGWIHHADEHHEESASAMPHLWSALPFVALLGAVAILPLIPSAAHWWEHNLNKFYVAVSLALLTLGYVAVLHPAASTDRAWHNFTHTMLGEYVPFIVLLFSLYTISGGIRIAGDLPAHSLTNMTFMLIGGLLASFIGTTGAAMLLIRPLLETNGQRKHVAHTVVFFIFI